MSSTETTNNFSDRFYFKLQERSTEKPEESYTSLLLSKGKKKILQKVGEEAIEVIYASASETKQETIAEIADLYYHLQVLMLHEGILPEDIRDALEKRMGLSGIEEKQQRKS